MPLTCPSCGNDQNFLVKTLQMHVVQLRDDSRVEASEEGRPAVIEVLCDECFEKLDEYVDLQIKGAPADEHVPGMRAHLEGCPACQEEYAMAATNLLALLLLTRPGP